MSAPDLTPVAGGTYWSVVRVVRESRESLSPSGPDTLPVTAGQDTRSQSTAESTAREAYPFPPQPPRWPDRTFCGWSSNLSTIGRPGLAEFGIARCTGAMATFRFGGLVTLGMAPAVAVSVFVGAVSPAAPIADFLSPLPGAVDPVTAFDPPDRRWAAGHRGIDLAATVLSPVQAPADATVLFAGQVGGKPVVSLDHGGGLRTTYEPVTATVDAGQVVAAGEVIGHLVAGHPGCPVEACLHWGARVASGGPSRDDDNYVNPLGLLADADRPIRLKPTQPGDGV